MHAVAEKSRPLIEIDLISKFAVFVTGKTPLQAPLLPPPHRFAGRVRTIECQKLYAEPAAVVGTVIFRRIRVLGDEHVLARIVEFFEQDPRVIKKKTSASTYVARRTAGSCSNTAWHVNGVMVQQYSARVRPGFTANKRGVSMARSGITRRFGRARRARCRSTSSSTVSTHKRNGRACARASDKATNQSAETTRRTASRSARTPPRLPASSKWRAPPGSRREASRRGLSCHPFVDRPDHSIHVRVAQLREHGQAQDLIAQFFRSCQCPRRSNRGRGRPADDGREADNERRSDAASSRKRRNLSRPAVRITY